MLLALKALSYTYSLAAFSIGTLVRECNWEGRGAGSRIVAKQALDTSLLLMLNILKPEEQLATEYVKTTAVVLLFWSQWHSSFLGCIHSEELGEAVLSRFSAHCRRNTACTSVQQSSDLFLTLPPVQAGEKVLRGVLTERCVAMFSANVKQFILTAHTQSMPIRVPVPDYKVEVRRLDAVDDMSFPRPMSMTRITTDRLKVVAHADPPTEPNECLRNSDIRNSRVENSDTETVLSRRIQQHTYERLYKKGDPGCNPQAGLPSDRRSGAARDHRISYGPAQTLVVVNNNLVPANMYLRR